MCARCSDLEDRIAWLESELGLQKDAETFARLHAFIAEKINPTGFGRGAKQPTLMALVLYRAKGRPVSHAQLMEAIPPKNGGEDDRTENIVKVWASCVRAALGEEAMRTVYGVGYSLTATGLDAVAGIVGEKREAAP